MGQFHQNSGFTSSNLLFYVVISVVLRDKTTEMTKNFLENFPSERDFEKIGKLG